MTVENTKSTKMVPLDCVQCEEHVAHSNKLRDLLVVVLSGDPEMYKSTDLKRPISITSKILI